MATEFNFGDMARIREEIGNVKGKYGSVGSTAPHEDSVQHSMFGKYEDDRDPSGMGGATKNFVSAVSKQYAHAEALLDSVERALDATERSKADTEHVNKQQMH